MAFAKAWGARHRSPITRVFLEVLEALLWGFHNSRTGCCFPSYESIAAKAECCRDTVYEALKVLELVGVLTWQNWIARIQVRERDLFGKRSSRWRVIRASNAYVFRDPHQRPAGVPASKSENPAGNTESRDSSTYRCTPSLCREVTGATSRSRQPIGGRTSVAGSKITREQERSPVSCLVTAAGVVPGSAQAASAG